MEAFGLRYDDQNGEKHPFVMGSYGIGQSRLLCTLVEVFHDKDGIIWPESVAPYAVHLVALGGDKNTAVARKAMDLYTELSRRGIEVLYDDRDISAGKKLADADFIGIPIRAVISEKTGDKIEFKRRGETTTTLITPHELIEVLAPRS